MKAEDAGLGNPSEALLQLTSDYCIQGHLFAYGNRRFTEGKAVGKSEGIKKVVEFVEEGGYLMGDKWQGKLEEWGIK